MENKIKAVLIDVDDCLIPTNGHTTPDFYVGLQQISRCIHAANNGFFPQIGFCSGRDRNYIEAIAFVAGLPDGWSVIESGIALFNPTSKTILLNDALIKNIREAFSVVHKERVPAILKRLPDLFEYPGNTVNVALERRNGAEKPIEEYYDIVQEMLSDLLAAGLITLHHSRIAIDISPPGIDKASGIKFLCRKTGLESEQILGMGDSRGDFPMLNLVGLVGCPANASEECRDLVQEKNGYISPYKYAFGVFDIMRHFISGLELI